LLVKCTTGLRIGQFKVAGEAHNTTLGVRNRLQTKTIAFDAEAGSTAAPGAYAFRRPFRTSERNASAPNFNQMKFIVSLNERNW